MELLKVTLECYSVNNTVTEDLELAGVQPETDWREAYILPKKIMALYHDPETGGTHIAFDNDKSWLVKENLNQLKEALANFC